MGLVDASNNGPPKTSKQALWQVDVRSSHSSQTGPWLKDEVDDVVRNDAAGSATIPR